MQHSQHPSSAQATLSTIFESPMASQQTSRRESLEMQVLNEQVDEVASEGGHFAITQPLHEQSLPPVDRGRGAWIFVSVFSQMIIPSTFIDLDLVSLRLPGRGNGVGNPIFIRCPFGHIHERSTICRSTKC